MGRKGSESRNRKRLEKKRAKRKEKVQEKVRRENVPLGQLPVHQVWSNGDWQSARTARILVSRRHLDGEIVLAEFLVDLDGFGLRDCFAPRRVTAESYETFVRREQRATMDPAEASALIHASVRWANRYRFPLPKEARKALDILPEAEEGQESPAEFGRDGEPYLQGDEADIRARVRQSGHQLEDFECALFPAAATSKRAYRFTTEEYLRDADRNDPLVRLERLAALADRYDQSGEAARAEELHATMEELAEQSNRLPAFLRYLAEYLVRQERMERAMQVYERIVEVTTDPAEKAVAQLDLADFSRYLGDALGADELYQKVIQNHPELLEIRLRYAAFLYDSARRAEAKEYYRRLIDEFKGRDDARELLTRAFQNLYTILQAEGEKSDAKAVYKEAKKEHGIRLR